VNATDIAVTVSTSRRDFIGGSDIPAIIGVSPWADEYACYLGKIGELPPPEGETKVQRRGKVLEHAIGVLYIDDAPHHPTLLPGITLAHPDVPHFRAQIDALEETDDGHIPIEIKSASEFTRGQWGRSGTDDAPTYYCAQLHWQLMATGAPYGRIVALLGADDLRVYTIERDEAVADFLGRRAAEFWERVQTRNAPPINFDHRSTGETLARLFRNFNATEIVQADDALRAWRDVMVQSGERIKEYEGVREGAKAHLLATMRTAAVIDFGDGTQYERKEVKRSGYTVESMTYVDARMKKTPKSKPGESPALLEGQSWATNN